MDIIRNIFSMIVYKSRAEIEIMREAAQIVSRTLAIIAERIGPGVTTLELDKLAEEYIRSQDAIPAFLGQYDFPNTLCTSINEEVVHGFPRNKPLREGDIVSVDCGAIFEGYYGDHAYTFAIGEVSKENQRLMRVTKECLYLGIEQAVNFNRVGDISNAVQVHAESHGYGVVTQLCGHGLGKKLHEAPQVPNYGKKRRGPLMKSGLTIAIEPMINMGTPDVRTLDDGWTVVTEDGLPSAHYEHDVAIVNGKPDILSTFDLLEAELEKKGDFYPKMKVNVNV